MKISSFKQILVCSNFPKNYYLFMQLLDDLDSRGLQIECFRPVFE